MGNEFGESWGEEVGYIGGSVCNGAKVIGDDKVKRRDTNGWYAA